MSVHTDFQHNPLNNKARRRVSISKNWGFFDPLKIPLGKIFFGFDGRI